MIPENFHKWTYEKQENFCRSSEHLKRTKQEVAFRLSTVKSMSFPQQRQLKACLRLLDRLIREESFHRYEDSYFPRRRIIEDESYLYHT